MFSWNGEVDALQFDSDIYFLQRWKKHYTEDERIKNTIITMLTITENVVCVLLTRKIN